MATNFPGSLDNGTSLPYPSATDPRNSPSLAGNTDNQNDALIAIETKLGTGASTPSGTNLLVSTGTGTSGWSKTAPVGTIVGTSDSQTLTNKTLTSPTINSPTITNATISADALTGFTVSNNGTVYGMSVTGGVLASAALANAVNTAALQANSVGAANLATNAIALGYAQIVTNFSTAATSATQITGLTASVTIPAGGRKIKIIVFGRNMSSSGSASYVQVGIWDGTVGSGTLLAQGQIETGAANQTLPCIAMAVVTPSAGAKTYNASLHIAAGSGTATLEAASTAPAFILVEAI